MSGFVLDCSVALSWCFEDEAANDTDALLPRLRDEGATVPNLWALELANVLAQAEKRGRITTGESTARIELLSRLPITTDQETAPRAMREILALARSEGLTSYDAAYLELALRLGIPLASKDKALRNAAQNLKVEILPK